VAAGLGSNYSSPNNEKPTTEDFNLDEPQFVEGNVPRLVQCFSRLANSTDFAFDRLSRYEAGLWRQVGQLIFLLNNLRHRKKNSDPGYPTSEADP
jgi:hypothetical protein